VALVSFLLRSLHIFHVDIIGGRKLKVQKYTKINLRKSGCEDVNMPSLISWVIFAFIL
jgi:hypothetical protein